jgi:hypothetical protein
MQENKNTKKINFDDLLKNFDLKKFIKYLDKSSKNKNTNPVLINSPEVFNGLLKSCISKKIDFNKLLKSLWAYEVPKSIPEVEVDFIHSAIQNGTLLPHINDNFKLEKTSDVTFDDESTNYDYNYQIISSKINKSYYIFVVYDNFMSAGVYFCLKKLKNKNSAINFIKEEQKKLKKFYKR